jgi:hypothetical protein
VELQEVTLKILSQKLRLTKTQHQADFKNQRATLIDFYERENRNSQNSLLKAFNLEVNFLKDQLQK